MSAAATTAELLKYSVDWGDFDTAFAYMDEPGIGLALIKEPDSVPQASKIIQRLDRVGEGVSELIKLRLTQSDDAISGVFVRQQDTDKVTPRNGLDITPEFKADIMRALSVSCQIRQEIMRRFISKVQSNELLLGYLQPYAEQPSCRPKSSEYGLLPNLRIDYLNYRDYPRLWNDFNERLHVDDTILTEHGGQTEAGFNLNLPGTDTMTPIAVPEGFRLIFRGVHWQNVRSAEHLPTPHSAESIDKHKTRSRWITLWRGHSIGELLPKDQLERCGKANAARLDVLRWARD